MKTLTKQSTFKNHSLRFKENEGEVVVFCSGEGLTVRVFVGLMVWGVLALVGLTMLLPILVSPLFVSVNFHNYCWAIGVFSIPTVLGFVFMLQSFRLGWNSTVLVITNDQIKVRYEGKYSQNGYSFPLSKIRSIGVRSGLYSSYLVIKFHFQDFRRLLTSGSKSELEWVEDKVRERLGNGGWSCSELDHDMLGIKW